MEDVPWLYVAMIFIAFVSWIFNRIQEASAARRQGREGTQEEEWEGLEEYNPPTRQPDSAPSRPSQPAPRAEPEPPQSLRDVFREIEKQMAEAKRQQEEQASPFPPPARAPEPPAVPPPLPSTARAPSPPATASRAGAPRRPSHASSAGQRTVDAERAAGVIPQSARTARLTESQRQAYSHKHNTRDTADALSRILRNRRNLRVAFLLKEILDEPKALRRD